MRVAVPIIRHQPANHSTFEIETEHTFQHTNLHTYIWAIVSPYSLTRLDRTYMCETRNNRPKRRRRKRRDRIKTYISILADLFRVFTKICAKRTAEENHSFQSDHCCCCCCWFALFLSRCFFFIHSLLLIRAQQQPTRSHLIIYLSLARELTRFGQ